MTTREKLILIDQIKKRNAAKVQEYLKASKQG